LNIDEKTSASLVVTVPAEVALKTFNDKNGEFVEGNRYVFAYDFDGNALAHPIQPEFIGKNRIDIKDPNGVEYIRDMIALARSEGGFIYYIKQDREL
jgi:polar amino acid transport system substrate-binding protein